MASLAPQPASSSALLRELATLLDAPGLQTGEAIEIRFRKDWYAPLGAVPPLAVVRPRNTEDVAAVLALCHRLRQPVVPAKAGRSMADENQRLQTAEEQARMQRQAAQSRR